MVGEAKPGDKVEVKYAGRTHVGILMPRPDMAEKNHITLKLSSGYDIGLESSKIESVRVLETAAKPKPRKPGAVMEDASKPVVSILSTGGTIASRVDYTTGGVYASSTAADLLESMPELARFASIRAAAVMNVMSEDMTPARWVEVAQAVAKELNSGADGVVVTHGTDTMAYSTAALSFLLKGLGKPVVFTGAQRSTDRGSADSFLNLACSVAFAKSECAGVYLVMHGSMADEYCLAHRGTKVRKMHTTRRDAFQSINASPAARIYADGRVEPLAADLPRRSASKVTVEPKLEERVAMVKMYPGIDPGIFDYHLKNGIKGIVIEGTALGHVPTRLKTGSVIPKLEAMSASGVLVAMTTQCLFGRVNPHVYSNLREVSSRGVVYCEDMLPETAYAKMMWVLGKAKSLEEAKAMMVEDVAGEITDRTLPEDRFISQ
jgi:glutamyl-tRNA(Gln) amidotransferase subunit D